MSNEATRRLTRAKHVLSNAEGRPSTLSSEGNDKQSCQRSSVSFSDLLRPLRLCGRYSEFRLRLLPCWVSAVKQCFCRTSKDYCVLTATLVEPRVTLPPSLKRTKMRFTAGSNGILPLPCTKIPKEDVALALIVVVRPVSRCQQIQTAKKQRDRRSAKGKSRFNRQAF